MAKVLRLHKESNDNITDWGLSKRYGKDVINQMTDPVGETYKKEITSIPSPFARFDLAKNAFKRVVDSKDLEGITIHHKTVSDCLDVAELFFNYDKFADKLEIIVWDRDKELDKLKKSPSEEHRILGHSLAMYLNQDRKAYNFDNFDRIYLLNYIGPNKPAQMNILGATSSSTLFVSSANDLSYCSEYLKSNGKDLPFDNDFFPLYRRDFAFQKYLYALRESDGRTIFANKFPEFNEYLNENYSFLTDDQKRKIDKLTEESINQYDDLSLDGNTVEVLGLKLRKNTSFEGDKVVSDFIVKSSIYKGVLPLALPVKPGNEYVSLRYVQDNWTKEYHAPFNDNAPLNKRVLPHTSETYPYLTIGDFLQPTLISMPYQLSENYFDGNINEKKKTFLLPLTNRFFDFFTIKDLMGVVPGGKKMIEIRTLPPAAGSAEVILRIPIQNNQYVEYRRVYINGNPVKEDENKGSVIEKKFGLGVMPLVDYEGASCTPSYRIAFFSKEPGCELSFKKDEKPSQVKSHIVRRKALPNCSIESYVVEESFNQIMIETDGVKNVIVPIFKEVGNAASFTFAVDFGTTNTHIEYSEDKSTMSKSFDIKQEEKQIQRMHKSYGADVDIQFAFEDAFIPDTIDDGAIYTFPIRTALAENKQIDYKRPTNCFSDANVPFRFEKAQIPSYNKVITDIKWSNAERERVTLYIENLFFLMRNKVLLNGGDVTATRIIWFYPVSMTQGRFNEFKKIWGDLYTKYFGGSKNNLVVISESVAPYYYYKNKQGLKSNSVTIDIGGGTTDVFIVDDGKPKILSSFRFAANSIFGDGYNFSVDSNGFVRAFKDNVRSRLASNTNVEGVSNILNALDGVEQSDNSNDIIAFYFSLASNRIIKNAAIPIDFSQMLADEEKYKYVFIIFYGAIFYYVANMMKAKGLSLPQTLAFSGNGSKTISVLSSEKKMVERFATLIFEKVFGQSYGSENLEIILSEEPKLSTCKGGISSRKDNLSFDDVEGLKASLLGTDNRRFINDSKYVDLSSDELVKVASNVKAFIDFIFNLDVENKGFFAKCFNSDQKSLNKAKDICQRDLLEYTKQGLNKKFEELESWGLDKSTEIEETLFFYPLVPILNKLASDI